MMIVNSGNAAILVLLSASCQFVNGFRTAFLQPPKIISSPTSSTSSSGITYHGSMSLSTCYTKRQPFPNLRMSQDDEEEEEEEDDDDYEPLRDGVNSISWLPSLAATSPPPPPPPSPPKITTSSTA